MNTVRFQKWWFLNYLWPAIKRLIKLAPKNFVKPPISQFRMGKPLSIGKFWPKIVFFSWVPKFGSYIDDQNLKQADLGCLGHTATASLNLPVWGRMGHLGFGHQYTTQIKVLIKKIRFLAKIGRFIAVFPFLHFLASLPLQLCWNSAYIGTFRRLYL